MVEWRDESQAVGGCQAAALGLCGIEVNAVQDDLGAEATDGGDFDFGRAHGHDDGARNGEMQAGEGNALGVVACGRE
jgi:hypothetical protein